MKSLYRAFLTAGIAACAFAPALSVNADTLSQQLTLEDVRHAMTRTGFGSSPADLQTYVGQSRAALATERLRNQILGLQNNILGLQNNILGPQNKILSPK